MNMDIHAATQVPLIVPAIEELLREFSKVNVTDPNINLSVSALNCIIKHKIPESPRDLQLYNLRWQTPLIMSALGPDSFLEIIYSIMLEKSVIFVSDNLPLLSSAVLGIQQFLEPFKWSYIQIPILPRSLVDMIEAPMPFLVGLLRQHLQFVQALNAPM